MIMIACAMVRATTAMAIPMLVIANTTSNYSNVASKPVQELDEPFRSRHPPGSRGARQPTDR
jgi:hypothetical protein